MTEANADGKSLTASQDPGLEPTVVIIRDRPSLIAPDIWVPLGICSILVSSIPAHILMSFYKALQIAVMLGLTHVADKQVFMVFYLVSFAFALPFLVLVAAIVCWRIMLFLQHPRIIISADGIDLPPWLQFVSGDYLMDRLNYVWSEASFKRVIRWEEISAVEYRFSGDWLRLPRLQIDLADRNSHVNIDLLSLSQPDRKALAYALGRFAKQPGAASFLPAGEDAASSGLVSYTDMWLAGRAQKTTRILFPGESVKEGRYRIGAALSGGGQSNIYLAEDMEDSQAEVILKEFILPVWQILANKKRESYAIEAGILQRLSHPGIVRLLDSFEESGRACLILSRARGATLSSLIDQRGCLGADDGLRFGLALAEIIKYLHTRCPRVVHRDISPGNIIVDEDSIAPAGELKITLIDFASAVQEYEDREEAAAVGTLAYTAPEQFRGKATCQSDIYSFGATLYFALTANEPEPLSRLSPRSSNKSVNERLDSIVLRATEQDPAARYGDVDELLADLLAGQF